VERRALEVGQAGQFGDMRDVQCTDPGNQVLGDILVTVVGEYVPAALVGVPAGAGHLGVEPDVVAQVVLVRDPAQVVPDLRLR